MVDYDVFLPEQKAKRIIAEAKDEGYVCVAHERGGGTYVLKTMPVVGNDYDAVESLDSTTAVEMIVLRMLELFDLDTLIDELEGVDY